jgi:carbonic anhydrase/acetyltransferase-like protein (isoleucine patch superfamily)
MMRLFGLALVSLVPGWPLRRLLYRTLFRFDIASSARVGMLNLLDIRVLTMEEGAAIRGVGNIFMSVDRVEMGPYSRIGSPRVGLNLFRGTANKRGYPPSTFRLGACSLITLFHYFDLCGDVTFGVNCVVGGIRSVFFTHTLYLPQFEPLTIGDNVYVGSNAMFQMGVTIPSNCVIGMGAVVVKTVDEPDSLIAGNPARVVRSAYGYDSKAAFKLRAKPYSEDGRILMPDQML